MLLRTLFMVLFLTTLAETIVHGASALAQATLRQAASTAVRQELESAATAAQSAIAAAVAAGGDPQHPEPIAPSPTATCVLAAAAGCALAGRVTIVFSPATTASPSPCADGGCTIYVQANDSVGEGRVDASLAASAVASDGAVLASRAVDVTYRTMRVAPYAALAGSLDASLQRLAGAGPGDDGGAAPNGAAPGSLIDVIYENALTGKTMPANVWHAQVQNPGTAATAWSP